MHTNPDNKKPLIKENQIEEIVRAFYKEIENSTIEEEILNAIELLKYYEYDFDEEMTNRSTDPEFLSRHKIFIKIFTEIRKESTDSYFDTRIFAFEGVALHYLLVSNGLEKVFARYVKEKYGSEEVYIAQKISEIQGEQINIETILRWKQEIRVQAIIEYLTRMSKKNNETTAEATTVTVGMEFEYGDPANLYSEQLLDHGIRSQLDMHQTYLERALVGNQRTTPGHIAEIGAYKDTHDIYEHGLGTREVVTNPSTSYRTQLRELLYTQKVGGLLKDIAVHETFVGVILSEQHTQVMDVRAVLTASGYIYKNPQEGDEDLIEWAYGILEGKNKNYSAEEDPKPSITQSGLVYFPNFRTRNVEEITDTQAGVKRTGIEWRGFPTLNMQGSSEEDEVNKEAWESFSNYVRRVRHEWLTSVAIAAVQKETDRSNDEEKLSILWNDYVTQWENLLHEFGFKNIQPSERYEEYPANKNENAINEQLKASKYIIFLNKIEATMYLESDFSSGAKKIIRDFNQGVQRILSSRS